MSKARERQRKRLRNREQSRRSDQRTTRRQIMPEGSFELPQVNLPGGRWLLLVPLGIILMVVVIAALGLINPPELETPPNALWLDAKWAYAEHDVDALTTFTRTLRDNKVGRLFIYVSSLKSDNSWSGLTDGRNRFLDVEESLTELVGHLRIISPDLELYAWIEISTMTASGYRLDSLQVHNAVANFSNNMINQIGFDGVLLDVKPLFEENEDLLTLMRAVRDEIGFDARMVIAVPADLTPSGTDLVLPGVIAPGTEWDAEFKQRIAVLPDQIVITAYNSYHDNPVAYIEWVAYQVKSFAAALSESEVGATILISIPNYQANPPAHDISVEGMAVALEGVRRGQDTLEAEMERPLFAGVAIFTDHDLTDTEWDVFKQQWVQAN
jgi:hypothetical protein